MSERLPASETDRRPERATPARGSRARALLLCVVVVALSTGAQDCETFLALIEALNRAAYGRHEAPPPPAPPPPPDGLVEDKVLTSFDLDERMGSSIAFGSELFVASGAAGADGHVRVARTDPRSLFGEECEPPEEVGAADVDFGASVATIGDIVFVGAPGAATGDEGTQSGAVFMYRFGDEDEKPEYVGRIDPVAPHAGERFGANLAAEGDTLVIQAEDFLEGGTVHVYRRAGEGWSHEQTLPPPPVTTQFGRGLAILGGRILVGDPRAESTGLVHTYIDGPGGWASSQTTRSPNPLEGSEFGVSVGTSGNTMVVGAPNDIDFRGAAYVFTLTGGQWTLQQRLIRNPETAREGELFGTSVGISGNRIVVGVPLAEFHGEVEAWDRTGDTWTSEVLISPDELQRNDGFGGAVAIRNGRILVGAPGSGYAYDYKPFASKGTASPGKKPKVVPNAYMGFRPPPGLSAPLTDELELPRTLWAPYRAQLGAGVFDPDRTTGLAGAGFCIGVQTQEAPRVAFEVAGTFTSTGLDLQARTDAGAVGAPLNLPDTQRVEVSIERDQADVVLSVRPLGETSFQELARVAAGPQTRAFVPFIRSERVPSGAEIGYDDPVIESTGPAPVQAPETTLRDQTFDALTATLGAAAPLELPVADVVEAGTAIDAAAGKLQTALNTATAILEDGVGKRKAKTGPKPARKQLKKALKKLGVARKKLDKGKSAKAVLKQIEKASKFETKALQALSD